jgi:hypothetical protein
MQHVTNPFSLPSCYWLCDIHLFLASLQYFFISHTIGPTDLLYLSPTPNSAANIAIKLQLLSCVGIYNFLIKTFHYSEDTCNYVEETKADIKMYIFHSVRKTCWSRAKPQEELWIISLVENYALRKLKINLEHQTQGIFSKVMCCWSRTKQHSSGSHLIFEQSAQYPDFTVN